MVISPNPATDKLIVNLNGMEQGNYTVSIHNAKGMLITQQQLLLNAGNNTIDFNHTVRVLPNGMYILNVEGAQLKLSEKFIKQ